MIPLLVSLALLGAPAHAVNIKKLSNAEVGFLLDDPNAKADERVDAAEALGERHAVDQVEALARACKPGDVEDVCEHALAALEDIGGASAMEQVDAVLMQAELIDSNRNKAFKILKKQAPERAATDAPVILTDYRNLAAGFAANVIKYLPDQGLTDGQDLTILIATDPKALRRVRLAALHAAEDFHHPLLYTAQLALLQDTDAKVRVNAAKGLGRSGLPGAQVQPALVQVVRTDKKGNVRAAALSALRYYADASLLPMLYDEVLNEKNPIAWGHAMELLDALADETSVQPICKLLDRHENLLEETTIKLMHTLVRIGDPAAVPTLQSVESNTTEQSVRTEARIAIDALQASEDQRVTVLQTWPVIEVYAPDPAVQEGPALGVSLDEHGVVIWANE